VLNYWLSPPSSEGPQFEAKKDLCSAAAQQETTFEEDLRKAFNHFDTDHDGFITQKELKKAMKKNKMYLSKAEINIMMREADNDGDGRVSFEEFVQMMTQK